MAAPPFGLAFSTNAFKRASLEQAVEAIAAAGYSGVELMADVPHAYPPEMPGERIAATRALLDRLKLGISNINAFTLFAQGDTYHPTWLEEDATYRQKRIDHTRNCIALAAALGAKTISLQPGGLQGAMGRPEALARFADGLKEVLPAAAAAGVFLLVEPEPGLLIDHSDQCLEFLAAVNHPNLRMNADLGHFYCVGEDPATVLKTCAQSIGHVHLEDIRPNRVHQHMMPGTGGMDFEGIFATLREIQYRGWVTVELYPFEATAEQTAKDAMLYLNRFMQ